MKVDLVFNQVPGSVPGSEGIWRNGDIDPRILEHNTIYIYIYIYIYEVCSKSKCTDFLFKCLLYSPEIRSYLLPSMTLGKLHSGSNVFSTDHSSTGSHFL